MYKKRSIYRKQTLGLRKIPRYYRVPKKSVGGGIASGALSGAGTGAMFGPWGAAIGAVLGGTFGGIKEGAKQKQLKDMLLQQQREADALAYNQDLSQLKQYNNYYNVQGLQATAEDGMELPNASGRIMNNSGGLDPLSSSTFLFKGASHENGGIDLDMDSDGLEDVEVEGKEALYENMVFSKRRKLAKEAEEYLSNSGFKGMSGKTYAEAVEKLGKLQELYEEKSQDLDPVVKNTGDIMLDRVDEAMKTLFQIQEETKIQR